MNHPYMQHAQALVELVRQEKYIEAYKQFFSQDAQGVENFSYDWSDPITVWRDNLISKAKKRESMRKTVSLEVSNPSVFNTNQCIVHMKITTKTQDWETKEDQEYVLYTRENEKVIEERFFYIMPEYEWSTNDQLARKFFQDLQQPDFKTLYTQYFATDASSIEAWWDESMPAVTTGVSDMIAKWTSREKSRETIDWYTKDLSLVNNNQFIVSMWVTSRRKETWTIETMSEYVLYTLKDSKIIEERFFYTSIE